MNKTIYISVLFTLFALQNGVHAAEDTPVNLPLTKNSVEKLDNKYSFTIFDPFALEEVERPGQGEEYTQSPELGKYDQFIVVYDDVKDLEKKLNNNKGTATGYRESSQKNEERARKSAPFPWLERVGVEKVSVTGVKYNPHTTKFDVTYDVKFGRLEPFMEDVPMSPTDPAPAAGVTRFYPMWDGGTGRPWTVTYVLKDIVK